MLYRWKRVGTPITLGAGGAEYLRDLEDHINLVHGGQDLSVVAHDGDGWRIAANAETDEELKCEHLQEMELRQAGVAKDVFTRNHRVMRPVNHRDPMWPERLTGSPVILPWWWAGPIASSPMGLSEADIVRETRTVADWIEDRYGARPTSFSLPNHFSTRHFMKFLRSEGFTAARDGWPADIEPVTCWLLGSTDNDLDYLRSWTYFCPYQLACPLPAGGVSLNEAMAQAADAADMDDLFRDTTTWNTNHPAHQAYLYGAFTKLVDQWAYYHSWVQVYAHGYGVDMTDDQLGWAIDALQTDGRFWISDLATIAAFAHDKHEQSAGDNLIYDPKAGEGCADGAGTPWNGEEAAFTFTCDIERDTVQDYADMMDSKGVNMTALISLEDILDGTFVDTTELDALVATGNVDLGVHGYKATYCVRRRACTVVNGGAEPRGIEMVDDGGTMKMNLYIPEDEDEWYDPIKALDGFGGIFIADDLNSLGNGASISTYYAASGDLTGANTGGNRPTLATNAINTTLSAVDFDSASSQYHTHGNNQIYSNTNGLTVFCVFKRGDMTNNRTLVAHAGNANNERAFRFNITYAWIYDGAGNSQFAALNPGDLNWHVLLMTWVPGSNVRTYIDNVLTATSAGTMATLGTPPTQVLETGAWRGTSDPADGQMACWGWLSRGLAAGHADLTTVHDTLKDHYGL